MVSKTRFLGKEFLVTNAMEGEKKRFLDLNAKRPYRLMAGRRYGLQNNWNEGIRSDFLFYQVDISVAGGAGDQFRDKSCQKELGS